RFPHRHAVGWFHKTDDFQDYQYLILQHGPHRGMMSRYRTFVPQSDTASDYDRASYEAVPANQGYGKGRPTLNVAGDFHVSQAMEPLVILGLGIGLLHLAVCLRHSGQKQPAEALDQYLFL